MKKFFKNIEKLKILIAAIIIFGVTGVIVYRYIHDRKKVADAGVESLDLNPVKRAVSKNTGQVNFQKEIVYQTNPQDAVTKAKADSLAALLDVKNKDILSITEIKQKTQDSLKLTRIEKDNLGNKLMVFEKKYAAGSEVKYTLREKDTVIIRDENSALTVTDFIKNKKWYQFHAKDTMKVSAYNPDGISVVNGIKTFRKNTAIRPKRIGIGLQAGYYYAPEAGKLYPGFGLGLSYNFIRF